MHVPLRSTVGIDQSEGPQLSPTPGISMLCWVGILSLLSGPWTLKATVGVQGTPAHAGCSGSSPLAPHLAVSEKTMSQEAFSHLLPTFCFLSFACLVVDR